MNAIKEIAPDTDIKVTHLDYPFSLEKVVWHDGLRHFFASHMLPPRYKVNPEGVFYNMKTRDGWIRVTATPCAITSSQYEKGKRFCDFVYINTDGEMITERLMYGENLAYRKILDTFKNKNVLFLDNEIRYLIWYFLKGADFARWDILERYDPPYIIERKMEGLEYAH